MSLINFGEYCGMTDSEKDELFESKYSELTDAEKEGRELLPEEYAELSTEEKIKYCMSDIESSTVPHWEVIADQIKKGTFKGSKTVDSWISTNENNDMYLNEEEKKLLEKISRIMREQKNIFESEDENPSLNLEIFKDVIQKSAATINNWPDRDNYSKYIKPEMRLYGVNDIYFKTIDELLGFCRENQISIQSLTILDYYRNLYGCKDVIKETDSNHSIFYTVSNTDTYNVYEGELNNGDKEWKILDGSIRDLYKPFRDQGVVFEDDVYASELEKNQPKLEYCKGNNLNKDK